jgi:hypothetical protein
MIPTHSNLPSGSHAAAEISASRGSSWTIMKKALPNAKASVLFYSRKGFVIYFSHLALNSRLTETLDFLARGPVV